MTGAAGAVVGCVVAGGVYGAVVGCVEGVVVAGAGVVGGVGVVCGCEGVVGVVVGVVGMVGVVLVCGAGLGRASPRGPAAMGTLAAIAGRASAIAQATATGAALRARFQRRREVIRLICVSGRPTAFVLWGCLRALSRQRASTLLSNGHKSCQQSPRDVVQALQ